jgi:hypothetical protein
MCGWQGSAWGGWRCAVTVCWGLLSCNEARQQLTARGGMFLFSLGEKELRALITKRVMYKAAAYYLAHMAVPHGGQQSACLQPRSLHIQGRSMCLCSVMRTVLLFDMLLM